MRKIIIFSIALVMTVTFARISFADEMKEMEKLYKSRMGKIQAANLYSNIKATADAKQTAQPTNPLLIGDLNGNGRWDAADAMLIMRHVDAVKAGKASPLNNIQLALADLDGDGQITIADSRLVSMLVVQLISLNDLPNTKLGDLNGNGHWDAADVTLIMRHVEAVKAGKASPLNDKQLALADIDGDGRVTLMDSRLVSMLVVQKIGLNDLPEVILAYKAFDKNGDCEISGKEAIQGWQEFGSTFGKSKGQEGYDARYDFNGDGKVDIGDFSYLAVVCDNLDQDAELIFKAYKTIDKDGDSKISGKEAIQGWQEFNKTFGKSRGQDSYDARYDFNGDGKVDFGDFSYLTDAYNGLDPNVAQGLQVNTKEPVKATGAENEFSQQIAVKQQATAAAADTRFVSELVMNNGQTSYQSQTAKK